MIITLRGPTNANLVTFRSLEVRKSSHPASMTRKYVSHNTCCKSYLFFYSNLTFSFSSPSTIYCSTSSLIVCTRLEASIFSILCIPLSIRICFVTFLSLCRLIISFPPTLKYLPPFASFASLWYPRRASLVFLKSYKQNSIRLR